MTTKKKGYTVQEIANMAGVSRQSIYRLIKSKGYKPTNADGSALYSELIKGQILEHYNQPNNDESKNRLRDQLASKQREIDALIGTIDTLKSELEIKNKQIETQANQFEVLYKLLDQAQTLNLLDKPKPPKSSAESEHTEQSSQKQAENRTQKDTDKPGKSWFSRIFKR